MHFFLLKTFMHENIYFQVNDEICVLNKFSHMDNMKDISAVYSQVAQAPLATRSWLWKMTSSPSTKVNPRRQSLQLPLLLLWPRPCVKDISQHCETSLYMLSTSLGLILVICLCSRSRCWVSWESQGNKWSLRGLIPLSHSWQVSSAPAREVPHKSTRCSPRTLPLFSAHAWVRCPPLLTCLLTYIWWKLGSLYSFLIISKRH